MGIGSNATEQLRRANQAGKGFRRNRGRLQEFRHPKRFFPDHLCRSGVLRFNEVTAEKPEQGGAGQETHGQGTPAMCQQVGYGP